MVILRMISLTEWENGFSNLVCSRGYHTLSVYITPRCILTISWVLNFGIRSGIKYTGNFQYGLRSHYGILVGLNGNKVRTLHTHH